jgi:uncharacterized iron-regulated membrane protein
MTTGPQKSTHDVRLKWPDYRAVWRWHFYAGLFCIPLVIILSITGSIYLFKTEIEDWIDRDCDHLTFRGASAGTAEQIRAALKNCPGGQFVSYEVPASPQAASRVIVRQNGQSLRVYVHPQSLRILKIFPEEQRFMRQIFKLHGELWLGDRGSNLVELAASWTIVLLLTGLVLWWPRNGNGLAGVLFPRLHKGQRIFWRDLHSVTGIWISLTAFLWLISGLPWSQFWGDYFKAWRSLTGTSVATQEWNNRSQRSQFTQQDIKHDQHDRLDSSRASSGSPAIPIDLDDIEHVLAIVTPLELLRPVLISPPRSGTRIWSVKSMTPNRPRRVTLSIDAGSGEIISRDEFNNRHVIDRIVGIGIAAHEGRLFGWPNQLIGLLTAAGLLLVSVSGACMWWRRREAGVLGAPKRLVPASYSLALIMVVIVLGILLPIFGISLLLILLLERLLFCRVPLVRDWLGL